MKIPKNFCFTSKRNKQKIMDECAEEQEDFDCLKEFIDFVREDDDLKKPILKKLDLLFVNDSTIVLSENDFE